MKACLVSTTLILIPSDIFIYIIAFAGTVAVVCGPSVRGGLNERYHTQVTPHNTEIELYWYFIQLGDLPYL